MVDACPFVDKVKPLVTLTLAIACCQRSLTNALSGRNSVRDIEWGPPSKVSSERTVQPECAVTQPSVSSRAGWPGAGRRRIGVLYVAAAAVCLPGRGHSGRPVTATQRGRGRGGRREESASRPT
jgi:hypothetical protein